LGLGGSELGVGIRVALFVPSGVGAGEIKKRQFVTRGQLLDRTGSAPIRRLSLTTVLRLSL